MAVSITTHSQAGTWTAAQLRSLFEASFIANGIMTAWYDSFTAGTCALGVVERVYDVSKTYGTTYYVFKFSTTGVYVYDCDSWDAGTHVPNGTLHDTYASGYSFSSTTGGNGDYSFMNVVGTVAPVSSINFGVRNWTTAPSTQVILRCFTSGEDPTFKLFELRNGSNYGSFMFPRNPASNIDLDTFMYNGLQTFCGYRPSSSTIASLWFSAICNGPRRSAIGGAACGLDTSLNAGDAAYVSTITANYSFPQSGGTSVLNNTNIAGTATTKGMHLPVLRAGQLGTPAPSDKYYVHTGLYYSHFESVPNMPNDFGFYYAQDSNTTVVTGDTLVVTPGVTEYEVLHAFPATNAGTGYMWGGLVARTV